MNETESSCFLHLFIQNLNNVFLTAMRWETNKEGRVYRKYELVCDGVKKKKWILMQNTKFAFCKRKIYIELALSHQKETHFIFYFLVPFSTPRLLNSSAPFSLSGVALLREGAFLSLFRFRSLSVSFCLSLSLAFFFLSPFHFLSPPREKVSKNSEKRKKWYKRLVAGCKR